jgi:plasmid replication initiation protein
MATIWDADILIYCASVLNDLKQKRLNDPPRVLKIMPYDLLRVLGRPISGRSYSLLGGSLDRLQSTTIKTNIRAAEDRREATFSWLDSWSQLIDGKTERSRGISLALSNWFYEGVVMTGGVLSIDRAYFDISGGRERWLYKVARKHAGGAGETGFAIALPTLFEKSGAEGQYRRFKFEIAAIVSRNELPGLSLALEEAVTSREPLLRMTRIPTPAPATTLRVRTAVAEPLPKKASVSSPRSDAEPENYLTDATLIYLRRHFRGWDFHALHAEYRGWLAEDSSRFPQNYQTAFIGFVRRYHEKNHHQL